MCAVLFSKFSGELRAVILAEDRAVGGEKVQGLVPVAQPDLSVRGLEGEAGAFQQVPDFLVIVRTARGQGDGEEMLGAVHGHRLPFGFGRFRRRLGGHDCRRAGLAGGGCGSSQMFVNIHQTGAAPGDGVARPVEPEEHRRASEGVRQLGELGARELEKGNGRGLRPDALQHGEPGHEGRRRHLGEIEFQPHGDGVAGGGAGEVGRQEEAEHGKS